MPQILCVSEINQYIKQLLDFDDLLAQVYVKGEISNLKRHSSGHIYFTLKDETSSLMCVLFRQDASKIKFALSDGMRVVALGRLSVFIRDGRYQLYASDLQPDGIGALYLAYEQLKKKLQAEGLFDSSHKNPIPVMPMKIALVTSPTRAAVRDMIRVLGMRFPLAKLLVCPVRVQGEGASGEISGTLKFLSDKKAVDLIILGRGGGSIEDLWPFNEEIVARAIYNCTIPIISAVGHEPDETISDYAADLRAATPSNGAELAVPEIGEIRLSLKHSDVRMTKAISHILSAYKERLQALSSHKVLQGPAYKINEQRMLLDSFEKDLTNAIERKLDRYRHRLRSAQSAVEAMSPLGVLERGYSIASLNGSPIQSYKQVQPDDRILISLHEGRIICRVEDIKEK